MYFGKGEDWTEPPAIKGAPGTWYQNVTTPCMVKMIDTPGLSVDSGAEYSQNQQFTGRVYDICNNNAIVQTEKFSFSMSGTAPAAGASADDASSGSATVVSYDGISASTPTHAVANDGQKTVLR